MIRGHEGKTGSSPKLLHLMPEAASAGDPWGLAENVLQRVVAWGDGWLPNRITPEQLRESRATLDKLATEAGRDATAITMSVYGQPADRDLITRFHDAGAERVVVRPSTAKCEPGMATGLERIAEAVLR
jgi:alkanesulfonate monooxygenase SsuD/methylene tetrahydromethanopterin reductase-like flavin-dependent oxidoreductase (luciferase family)